MIGLTASIGSFSWEVGFGIASSQNARQQPPVERIAALRRIPGLIAGVMFLLISIAPALAADVQFTGWTEVPGHSTTNAADAATVYSGKLYLFGIGINDHAHYVNTFDGTHWAGWTPVPGSGTTNLPDAATLYNGKLYLFGIGINDHAHYVNVGAIQVPVGSLSPHFDEVFQKGSHNAYWVNNKTSPDDPYAAGTQMRLWDQLVHEHVRSIELDLHRDIDDPYTGRGSHPGEFRVYHTNEPENSTCFSLADCLQLLQRLDYVLPSHEVIHIALELKQVDRFFYDDGLFDDSSFQPEEIDRLLWEHLGPRLYTPVEFMSRCDQTLNLRQCAAQVGWPTVDQLRGRYIVTVHGTETGGAPGACNERSWWQYASADIRTRAAFPMFVAGGNAAGITDTGMPDFKANRYNANNPEFKAIWRRALDNTIFFQLEDPENPDFKETDPKGAPHTPLNRLFHGIVRSTAAHLVDHPVPPRPPALEDNVGNIEQTQAVSKGWQIVMTDYPANFILDVRSVRSPQIPSRVDQPFFHAAEVGLPSKNNFAPNALIEPGSRIYFDTANRITDYDLLDISEGEALIHGAKHTNDPTKRGAAKLVRVAPQREREPVEDWEVFSSTSMVGHSAGPLETTPFGEGCIDVGSSADYSGDLLRVCRNPVSTDDRLVNVEVTTWLSGKIFYSKQTALPHHIVQTAPIGDALRVRVDRTGNGTTISVFTAAEMNPDGSPLWIPYPDNPFHFTRDLAIQGLFQVNDGVFTGTRLNGRLIPFSEFNLAQIFPGGATAGTAYDLSFCTDGSCRGQPLDSHESVSTGRGGDSYIGIHETEGSVYDQWRTLYTTDVFEVRSSGLNQFPVFNKFMLLKSNPKPGKPMTPLYKCIDWRRDYHQHWLSTDQSCPNPNTKEPYARSGGQIGYIATRPLPETQPLWHLRKGTQNAGSADTHDHYFAVGNAQRDVKINKEGYSLVGPAPVGWVYVQGALP